MIRRFLTVLFLTTTLSVAHAGEGMWIPLLLKALEGDMQAMGMKMTAEDIYSVNQGSLKDAIVHFGGFCTAEVISDQGLILTNHHCGYGQIQSHSTLENNYLEDGFWAMNNSEELPNPGLYARFIVRIIDATEMAMAGVTDDMTDAERQSMIDKNLGIAEVAIRKEDWQEVMIRPFFKGNQYFAFVTETYNDVRLVGAPPSSIGKFGADTDNWVWPRHTGDFSMFRIYASPDNRPADYSPDNVPLKPRHSLPISLDGVDEGDFTMVFGFPGRTDQYLPSYAVENIIETIDPTRIAVRERSLEIIDQYMRSDAQAKIQYASRFASIANGWKKWIGEVQGLKSKNAVAVKRAYEAEFTKRVNANPAWRAQYGALLPRFEQLYTEIEPYAKQRELHNEVLNRNVEIFRVASLLDRLAQRYENNGAAGYTAYKARLDGYFEGFYKNYRPEIDRDVLATLLQRYHEGTPADWQSAVLTEQMMRQSSADYVEKLFADSRLTSPEGLTKLYDDDIEDAIEHIDKDPIVQLYRALTENYNATVAPRYSELNDEIDGMMRDYMAAQMAVFPEHTFWPDANSTLRVTYGKMMGYEPRDAVYYQPQTYLDGVIEKYVPGDYEFDLPAKLIELYEAKDYGEYADDNGKIPVCLIGSNHTSGGNSGSPAIDASGNLVGLNFDRVWEGTMSDIFYDAEICRNIMVDTRYVLFIVDKFAGAGWLIEEMKLVHPKK